VICDYIGGLCVFAFQGSLLVIVITIDDSEKRNCEGGFNFELRSSRVLVKSAVKTLCF